LMYYRTLSDHYDCISNNKSKPCLKRCGAQTVARMESFCQCLAICCCYLPMASELVIGLSSSEGTGTPQRTNLATAAFLESDGGQAMKSRTMNQMMAT
jgi:hypothetical protein